MIQVNSNCYMNVEFDGLTDFNLRIFTKLVIKESAEGLRPPIFELHLFQLDYSLYPSLTTTNKEIYITYGSSTKNARRYKFRLYNYVYANSDTGTGYNLILTGFLDLKNFTNVPRIRAINNTSDVVAMTIDSLTPKVNYTGQDKQVWIQHGISDKNFIERVIQHAYTEDQDLICAAINVDSSLIVSSIKNVYAGFKEGTTFKIKQDKINTQPNSLRFSSLSVESDSALWSQILAEGRVLPVMSVKDRSVTRLSPTIKSIIDDNNYQGFTQNCDYPITIDSGNCHNKYYQAWVNNLNYFVQFSRNGIYIFSNQNFLNSDTLTLLDLVQFVPNDPSKNELVDPMSGKYIHTEKMTQITQRGFSHRLKLNRDYTL